jgi:hypothetical protein
MRNISWMILGSLFISLSLAQASGSRDGGHDNDRWSFNCRFMGKDNGKQKEKGGSYQCSAHAEVCEYSDRGHGQRRDEHDRCENRLSVSCNGLPVYSNGALHSSDGLFEFLVGQNNNPVLKYTSGDYDHDHREHESRSFMIPSWLNVNGAVLDGFCAVEQIYRNCR